MIVAFENVEKIYGDKMPKPLTIEMQKHIDR